MNVRDKAKMKKKFLFETKLTIGCYIETQRFFEDKTGVAFVSESKKGTKFFWDVLDGVVVFKTELCQDWYRDSAENNAAYASYLQGIISS